MDLEELANKYSMKDLRPLAKKYGMSLRCAKKMDVLKALPLKDWQSWKARSCCWRNPEELRFCPMKLIDNNLFYHPAPLGIV